MSQRSGNSQQFPSPRLSARKILGACLFANDLDPFAIFKDERARDRFSAKHGRHEDYFLEYTKADLSRARAMNFARAFIIYLTIKGLALCFLEYEHLQHDLHYYPRAKEASKQSQVNLRDRPTISKATLEELDAAIGNPLRIFGGLSVYIYFGASGLVFIFAVILPLHYHRHKMDMPFVRLYLNQELELRRVRCSMRRKLMALQSSIRTYGERRSGNGRENSRLAFRMRSPTESASVLVGCHKLSHILDRFRSPVCLAELCVYNASWFRRVDSMQAILMASVNAGLLIMSITFWLIMYIFARHTPVKLFGVRELICSVEILLQLALTWLFVSNHISLLTLNVVSQSEVISSMSRELREFRHKLGHYSDLVECLSTLGRDVHNAPADICTSESSPAGWPNASDLALQQLERLADENHQFMLTKVLRIETLAQELRQGFKCISQLVSILLYHATGLVVILIATRGMQTEFSSHMHNLVIFFIWFILSGTTTFSSYLFARVIEMQRARWYVRADMTRIMQRLAGLCAPERQFEQATSGGRAPSFARSASFRSFEAIVELWHRHVTATSMSIELDSVKLFEVSLKYKRVLELNFLTLVVYAITVGGHSLVKT